MNFTCYLPGYSPGMCLTSWSRLKNLKTKQKQHCGLFCDSHYSQMKQIWKVNKPSQDKPVYQNYFKSTSKTSEGGPQRTQTIKANYIWFHLTGLKSCTAKTITGKKNKIPDSYLPKKHSDKSQDFLKNILRTDETKVELFGGFTSWKVKSGVKLTAFQYGFIFTVNIVVEMRKFFCFRIRTTCCDWWTHKVWSVTDYLEGTCLAITQ